MYRVRKTQESKRPTNNKWDIKWYGWPCARFSLMQPIWFWWMNGRRANIHLRLWPQAAYFYLPRQPFIRPFKNKKKMIEFWFSLERDPGCPFRPFSSFRQNNNRKPKRQKKELNKKKYMSWNNNVHYYTHVRNATIYCLSSLVEFL